MIEFAPVDLSQKKKYDPYLLQAGQRGCAYSFANLYMWGRQSAAFVGDTLAFFCQFRCRSVYLFPVGEKNLRAAVDAVIHDAAMRGIPCRLIGMTKTECRLLQQMYPSRFRYHCDRDSFDYVYDIAELASLKGRKFQKKRNHLNRFRLNYPDAKLLPITCENMAQVRTLAEKWYTNKQAEDPHGDYLMEQAALKKAMDHFGELQMEGLILVDGDKLLAMTMGSRLSSDTFDIHFEKALDADDGSYAAINQGFARYLGEKYPEILWLNREDDMGLEGLRKAKLSYCPTKMVEKYWACLLEDGYDY